MLRFAEVKCLIGLIDLLGPSVQKRASASMVLVQKLEENDARCLSFPIILQAVDDTVPAGWSKKSWAIASDVSCLLWAILAVIRSATQASGCFSLAIEEFQHPSFTFIMAWQRPREHSSHRRESPFSLAARETSGGEMQSRNSNPFVIRRPS